MLAVESCAEIVVPAAGGATVVVAEVPCVVVVAGVASVVAPVVVAGGVVEQADAWTTLLLAGLSSTAIASHALQFVAIPPVWKWHVTDRVDSC